MANTIKLSVSGLLSNYFDQLLLFQLVKVDLFDCLTNSVSD